MKKIMTLCFFAFAMVLGTQTSAAQSIVEVNALASQKTKELKKTVKFNKVTEDLVYQTYQEYARVKFNNDKVIAEGGTITTEDKDKMNTFLNEKFKSIFSGEEWTRYETYLSSHE